MSFTQATPRPPHLPLDLDKSLPPPPIEIEQSKLPPLPSHPNREPEQYLIASLLDPELATPRSTSNVSNLIEARKQPVQSIYSENWPSEDGMGGSSSESPEWNGEQVPSSSVSQLRDVVDVCGRSNTGSRVMSLAECAWASQDTLTTPNTEENGSPQKFYSPSTQPSTSPKVDMSVGHPTPTSARRSGYNQSQVPSTYEPNAQRKALPNEGMAELPAETQFTLDWNPTNPASTPFALTLPDPSSFPIPPLSLPGSASASGSPCTSRLGQNSHYSSDMSTRYSTSTRASLWTERSQASCSTSPGALRTSLYSDSVGKTSPEEDDGSGNADEGLDDQAVGLGITSDDEHDENRPRRSCAAPIAPSPLISEGSPALSGPFAHHRAPSWTRKTDNLSLVMSSASSDAVKEVLESRPPLAHTVSDFSHLMHQSKVASQSPPRIPRRKESRSRCVSELSQRSTHTRNSPSSSSSLSNASRQSEISHDFETQIMNKVHLTRTLSTSTSSSSSSSFMEYGAYSPRGPPRSSSLKGSPNAPVSTTRSSTISLSRSPSVRRKGFKPMMEGMTAGDDDFHNLPVGQREPQTPPEYADAESTSATGSCSGHARTGSDMSAMSLLVGPEFSHIFGAYADGRLNWDSKELDESLELDESNAVRMAEDGSAAIVEASGKPVSEVEAKVGPNTTHLILSDCTGAVEEMLNRVLPTTSNLVVLDVSGCQLDRIPPSLELCHQSLEELNISRNPLGSLPDWLSNLKSLRVLAADETGCRILPRSLSQLGGLQSLSLRRNRFTHVPVWIHNFSRLERLFVDGNPFEGTWRDILKPLLILPLSAPAADSPRSGQLFSDAHVPLKLQVPPALMPANPMTRQASGSASPGGLSMKAAATTYSDGSPIPSPAPRYGSPSPGIRGANMDPIARRMRSTNDLLLSQLNSSSNTLVSPNGSFASSQMTASPLSEAGPSHLRDELSDPSSQTNSFDSDGHNGTSDENNGGGPKWGGFLKKIGRKASNSRLNSSHGERMRGFESFTMGRENHTKRPSVKSAFSRPGSRPGSAIDPGHNSPAPMSPTNSFKGNSYFPEVGAAPLTPLGPAFVESPAKASSAAVKSNRRKSFLALEQLSLNFKVGPNTALSEPSEECLTQHRRALRGLLQYMKDLDDLSPHGLDVGSGGTTRSLRTIPSRPTLRSLVSLATGESTSEAMSRNSSSTSAGSSNISSIAKPSAGNDASCASSVSGDLPPQASDNDKAANRYSFKDDATRRKRIIEEIVQTEETYVRGLSELVEIYVRPAKNPLEGASGSPVVPLVEQRAVFGNIEGLLQFHVDAFLPCLRSAARPLLQRGSDLCEDEEASLTASVAEDIAAVFTRHSAFFKMYMSYINNCDFAQARIAVWLAPQSVITAAAAFKAGSASLSSSSNLASDCGLTPGQRKKLKSFMKRCRAHPKHHQLNVESYLLLPVQRIPRYRLLLEDLAKCTPPSRLREHDALLTALEHITRIASNVNESKRQSEQDRRLLGWQTRIRGRFPSPLVQPHRRLVRDGPLRLRRVTRRVPAFVKMHPDDMEPSHKFAPAADVNQLVGSSMEQVDCLSQIALDKPLTVLLCNDILVLVNDPSLGRDPSCPVTLHGVEMLKARPCEVYGGGSIRVVTERSVMHFCAVDEEDARSWRDSINAQLAS